MKSFCRIINQISTFLWIISMNYSIDAQLFIIYSFATIIAVKAAHPMHGELRKRILSWIWRVLLRWKCIRAPHVFITLSSYGRWIFLLVTNILAKIIVQILGPCPGNTANDSTFLAEPYIFSDTLLQYFFTTRYLFLSSRRRELHSPRFKHKNLLA